MKFLAFLFVFIFFGALDAIPDWYKKDIGLHISRADTVLVYEITDISLTAKNSSYFSYLIQTNTVQVLKGKPPLGECYYIHTEMETDFSDEIGKRRIAILKKQYDQKCNVIEPGFSAPATPEYLTLYRNHVANDPLINTESAR